jgi:hypothetical protein
MDKNVVDVVVVILVIVIGAIVYGAMTDTTDDVKMTATSTPVTASTSAQLETERQKQAAITAAQVEKEASTVAFTIDVTKLPEAQQASLKTIGMNDTKINVTNAMVTCAKADMSDSRLEEIKGGASVTMSEGVKLVSCYNVNS